MKFLFLILLIAGVSILSYYGTSASDCSTNCASTLTATASHLLAANTFMEITDNINRKENEYQS